LRVKADASIPVSPAGIFIIPVLPSGDKTRVLGLLLHKNPSTDVYTGLPLSTLISVSSVQPKNVESEILVTVLAIFTLLSPVQFLKIKFSRESKTGKLKYSRAVQLLKA
jgi:hypothetical protein